MDHTIEARRTVSVGVRRIERPRGLSIPAILLALVVAISISSVGSAGTQPLTPTPTPTPVFPRCDFTPLPNAGPPGTTVVLSGTCYPIHSGRPGAIYFDQTLVAHARGDTPGNYGAGFFVPPEAALGAHEISMRLGENDGPITARTIFTVLPFCRGDCDNDGRVSIADLVRGITVELGGDAVAACSAVDLNDDDSVTIDELIAAVSDALTGCVTTFTPMATPKDTPTPADLGGACRSTVECRQQELLCLEPGGFAGCVACREQSDECQQDSDCTSRGEGMICEEIEIAGPECLCFRTRLCIPGCAGDTDCKVGQQCNAAAHCIDRPCQADRDCPTHFYCYTGGVAVNGTCARRYCTADDECSTGFCVESRCYDAFGACVLRPGIELGE